MVRRMDEITEPSTAGPDEPHEALAQAEHSWQDVELAAEVGLIFGYNAWHVIHGALYPLNDAGHVL